jgi:hypothetical protein
MGLFGGLFKKKPLDKLMSCMLTPKGETWDAMWVSEGGPTPDDFVARTLTGAAERAASEIGALYRADRIAVEAELQFAIYPFSDEADLILDIQRGTEGFVASSVNGGDPSVQGDTLEALVDSARATVPEPRDVMFRWVRRVSELI